MIRRTKPDAVDLSDECEEDDLRRRFRWLARAVDPRLLLEEDEVTPDHEEARTKSRQIADEVERSAGLPTAERVERLEGLLSDLGLLEEGKRLANLSAERTLGSDYPYEPIENLGAGQP